MGCAASSRGRAVRRAGSGRTSGGKLGQRDSTGMDPEGQLAVARHRERERRMVEEGVQLWRRQKEEQWHQRRRDQGELKEMLAKYYPWGRPGCGAPNADGIRKRKLQLEGLFADDQNKSGVLLGRPGHGAPRRTVSGQPAKAMHADPLLQFQSHEPGRRSVNNVLRYHQEPCQQRAYRQQLDAMVGERRRALEQEKYLTSERDRVLLTSESPWGRPGPGGVCWRDPGTIGLNFLHSLGWSDEATLRALESRRRDPGPENSEGGVELVALLARRRAPPAVSRHPLSTTDVTKMKSSMGLGLWNNPELEYSRELGQQVLSKQHQIQVERQEDAESSRRHFETWQQFWGRPGHGAPRDVKVKGNIEVMLRQLPIK